MAETKNTTKNTTGVESNIAALLAYLFLGLGGLIFYLVEKEDKFVRFAAMQSIVLGVAIVALQIVYTLVIIPFALIGFGLILRLFATVTSLGVLVLWIMLMVKAYNGQEWEIPVLGKIARNAVK